MYHATKTTCNMVAFCNLDKYIVQYVCGLKGQSSIFCNLATPVQGAEGGDQGWVGQKNGAFRLSPKVIVIGQPKERTENASLQKCK